MTIIPTLFINLKRNMSVHPHIVFAELWTKCSKEMQAFVIMHLLTGEEEDEPWCVIVMHDVAHEDQNTSVLADLHQNCDSVKAVRQCYVPEVPFATEAALQPQISLLVCF